MNKRFLTLFLALILCLGILTPCVLAEDSADEPVMDAAAYSDDSQQDTEITDSTAGDAYTVASGVCGSNLNWTLSSTGTLTVRGKGVMAATRPWYSYRSKVKSIVIASGVTSIAKSAFINCGNLSSVTISGSVTSIGASAFAGCSALKTVKYYGFPGKWSAVSVGTGNSYLTQAARSYLLTVTYNANGGTGGPSGGVKTYGKSYTISSKTPTRTGYTFLGWSGSKTATTAKYLPGKSYTTIDLTLYAVWKAKVSTITYNANGGTGGPKSGTKTYGKSYTVPTTKPTRAGYTFLGWSNSKTATTAKYLPGKSYTSMYTTLYAVWRSNTSKITFNANGGTGGPGTGTKTYGQSYTIPTTKPTRAGYTFLGWSNSKTATTAKYLPGKSYTSIYLTLYAVWQKK